MKIDARGLVVSEKRVGEGDRLVTVLTDEKGRPARVCPPVEDGPAEAGFPQQGFLLIPASPFSRGGTVT